MVRTGSHRSKIRILGSGSRFCVRARCDNSMTGGCESDEQGQQAEGGAVENSVADSKGTPAGGRQAVTPERLIFGDNFRRAREDMGLSQREVARRLRTNQPFVSDVENGQNNLTIDKMARLAAFIGKPLYELLRPASRKG